tara:strand:- start:1241 stop:1627 length:387 start_codon:yes stop_codon:yes gene_type:complete
MSESEGLEFNGGRLQDFTIDQFAGALALSLGAVGTLLLVIWQSRCACKCRLGCSDNCYLFDCTREPPPIEVAEDPDKDKRDKKQDKILKKEDKILKKENEILRRSQSFDMNREGEPEPEPELLPPENP